MKKFIKEGIRTLRAFIVLAIMGLRYLEQETAK
jgi:hypothetical protein